MHFGATSGGIRTYLERKAGYVERRADLRHTIVIPAERDETTTSGAVVWRRLYGPPIPGQAPYRLLCRPGQLGRMVRESRPDLIEVGSPFLEPWLTHRANRTLEAPVVWFFHGNLPRIVAPDPSGEPAGRRALHRLLRNYVRRVGRPMDAVLAASDAAARDLSDYGVAPVERVSLGVDLERFNPARAARRDETRRRFQLPVDRPLAIYAGRLAREKQIRPVIEAWRAVEQRTMAQLVLVGAGPDAANLRRLAGADRVHWLNFQKDQNALADLLAAMDLYIAPGPAETFGLSALEAMASGLPVLSVDAGAVPELVRGAGAGGLYPLGDKAAIAEQAISLFESDLVAAGRRSRGYAEAHHAWEPALDNLFALYRRLAA
ncbi:MAG TPA: glycosyltransferase [Gemmatimonadales bacterium]|nr:glycosyltransferase [Gemmatimonadales bacterium]